MESLRLVLVVARVHKLLRLLSGYSGLDSSLEEARYERGYISIVLLSKIILFYFENRELTKKYTKAPHDHRSGGWRDQQAERLAALLVTPMKVYPVHLDKPTLRLLLQPSMLYQNKVLYIL